MFSLSLSCSPPFLHSSSSGALQIELSEESDQGKYECVATNSDGTRYSTPANLYVRGEEGSMADLATHFVGTLMKRRKPRSTQLMQCNEYNIKYIT